MPPAPVPMLAALFTMGSTTSTEVMVVSTTPVSLSVTSTPLI